jgi:predicted house-cleaning NTP pyrophosphatase (Maf/HAM1 superfamily)
MQYRFGFLQTSLLYFLNRGKLMNKVSAFEKSAYSMGAFGQNFIFGIMAPYLMILGLPLYARLSY